MNNLIKILFVYLLLTCSLSIAQEKLILGVNAGASYSNVRGNQYKDNLKFDYAADFLAGVSAEIPLNSNFSLFGNLNYERKSSKRDIYIRHIQWNENGQAYDGFEQLDVKETFSYLALPVNIRYYVGNKNRFFVNGGIFAAFLLNQTTTKPVEKYYSRYLADLDYGVDFGLGYSFKINGKNSLNLEIRDNLGLSNISEKEGYSTFESWPNSVNLILNWQFTL